MCVLYLPVHAVKPVMHKTVAITSRKDEPEAVGQEEWDPFKTCL